MSDCQKCEKRGTRRCCTPSGPILDDGTCPLFSEKKKKKKTRALARGWAKFYACWSPVFRITCVKNVKVPR